MVTVEKVRQRYLYISPVLKGKQALTKKFPKNKYAFT